MLWGFFFLSSCPHHKRTTQLITTWGQVYALPGAPPKYYSRGDVFPLISKQVKLSPKSAQKLISFFLFYWLDIIFIPKCKQCLGWFAKHPSRKERGLACSFVWWYTHVTGHISLALKGRVWSVKNNLQIPQRGVQRYSRVLCSHSWSVGGLPSIAVYKPCLPDAQVKLGCALVSCRSYPHEQ